MPNQSGSETGSSLDFGTSTEVRRTYSMTATNATAQRTSDILLAVNGEASHGAAPLGWELTFTTRRADGSATPPLLLSAGGFYWFCPGDSELSQFF